MNIDFKEIFKNIANNDKDILYCENRFRKLYKDFSEKKYDFRGHTLNVLNKDILQVYLEYYGFSYAANKLSSCNNIYDTRVIAKLLLDSNLVSLPKIALGSESSDKIDLQYSKQEGIYKEYKFVYNTNDFPFFIDTIAYDNTVCITCEKESSNSLSITINIGKEEKVNLIESIVVYTSLGIQTITITIRCKEEKSEIFGFESLEEFFKLCSDDREKALKIYKDYTFKSWIKVVSNINQLISYEESTDKVKIFKSYEVGFKHFCISNGVFIKDNKIVDVNIGIDTIDESAVDETINYNENDYKSEINIAAEELEQDISNTNIIINESEIIKSKISNDMFKKEEVSKEKTNEESVKCEPKVEQNVKNEQKIEQSVKKKKGLFAKLKETIFGSKKKGG